MSIIQQIGALLDSTASAEVLGTVMKIERGTWLETVTTVGDRQYAEGHCWRHMRNQQPRSRAEGT
jgi:hypothetical protein